MAWTQTDLTRLEAAIAKGVLRVRYASGEVQYQSLSDMLSLRTLMIAEIDGTTENGSAVFAGRIG